MYFAWTCPAKSHGNNTRFIRIAKGTFSGYPNATQIGNIIGWEQTVNNQQQVSNSRRPTFSIIQLPLMTRSKFRLINLSLVYF